MKSCLARLIADPMDVDRIKRDGWNEERILVLTPDQQAKLTNKEFETVQIIGNRIYGGKRNGKPK